LGPTLWALYRCWRAAPLGSLFGLLRERPLELAPPPPMRPAALPRRRAADA
jgi:hypothetical protein